MSMYGVEYAPLDTGPDGGAKQSFKDEVDINNILALYAKTGLLTPVTSRSPAFVDVSLVEDYQAAVQNIQAANDLFMDLPSAVRTEFKNDAAEFLDFCSDPDNEDRMREMGLLPPLEEAVVAAVEAPEEPEVPEVPAES